MEPKHTKSKDEETAVESLDIHDRIKELLDPLSQPTSLEKSEDEPVFQCKGDELRIAKMTIWMIAVTLILAVWLAVIFLPFLFRLPLTSLIFLSVIILSCAVIMQLKKGKSSVEVYNDRIEWRSFSINKQSLVRSLAKFPYTIHFNSMFGSLELKSQEGMKIGRLPPLAGAKLVSFFGAIQRMEIPTAINIVQPFVKSVDGQAFVNSNYFEFRRVLAFALPVAGAIVSFLIPRIGNLASSFTMLPFFLCCMMSALLQVGLLAKRKDRTGLLFGESSITRIKKDEVIWSLNASDIRSIVFRANAFAIRVEAITQYGRKYDLGVSGLHALKFALANNIPIVTESKSAAEEHIHRQ